MTASIRFGSKLTSGAGAAMIAAFAFLAFPVTPAHADLRLCNKTTSRVGVAIGYKERQRWTTEGWWNVAANTCETLVSGTLVSRYYYVYAVDYDLGGEWSGKYTMCTRDRMFTIEGIEDCIARGYDRAGFFEVDTGEQTSWTVQLTEPTQQGNGAR
ncbi:putative membrane protein [Prosthecomicrobium pneumaticum]|uniref:Putative membrane protein n=2 Tax=Prosthecomicrobium pneumaticum TaxID=81895 RepID=A0A7W9FL77_9HYPH|nr:putative membrane protein [Prosthecomicrobium pneumaticum]